MKRCVRILLAFALLLILALSASAAAPTVTVGSETCYLGTGAAEVVVPVSLSGSAGLAGCELRLSYDPALVLTRVEVGTALRSLVFTKPGDLTANPVKLVWDGLTADATNGVIANLTFTVPIASLGSYDVTLEYIPDGVYDGDLNNVALTTVPGTVSVVCPGHEWSAVNEFTYACTVCGKTTTRLATFRPENGAESEEKMTLADAFAAWASANHRGTIKLYHSPTTGDLDDLLAAAGAAVAYNTTGGESSKVNALAAIGAEANGGSLTLDLNGQSVSSARRAFLATTAELNGFSLTISNGTLSAVSPMALLLKGSAIGLKMDGVTVKTTSTGNAANPVHDCRWGGSYALLSNCTLTSASRAAIQLYTYSENENDPGTLLYYLKDCALTCSGSAQFPITHYKTSLASKYRLCTVITDCTDGSAVAYRTKSTNLIHPVLADSTYFLGGAPVRVGAEDDPPDESGYYSFTTDVSASPLTAAEHAAATLTVGDLTFNFSAISDALQYAERFGRSVFTPTLTLNEDVAVSAPATVGQSGFSSRFTLAAGEHALTDSGDLGLMTSVSGASVDLTVTGSFGGADKLKLFAGVPALDYSSGSEYVLSKGRFFTAFSLNLEDNVKLNLYTTGSPDAVLYQQDGTVHTIAAPDAAGAWVIDTLAAKEMGKTVDACAMKTVGGKLCVDFSSGLSVQRYVSMNPAAYETDADVIATLNATMDSMLIYGKLAEKYFAGDYTDLTEGELASIGVAAQPVPDTANLTHVERTVVGMADHTQNGAAATGYWGSSAVLEDSISLKFYFYGAEFDSAPVTVNGGTADLQTSGSFRFVRASVTAKDFDKPITVAFDGVGSVTDSVEAYTARVEPGSDAYRLAQALRAYGADAKRYNDAKIAAKG